MEPTRRHRKQVRHYHDPGHVHDLTFSGFRRWPLLNDDLWRQMLSQSIDRALQHHRYQLAAFVFMPEHVHLLIYPRLDAAPIDAALRAIKRPFSYRVKQLLSQSDPRMLEKLTIRQRPGVNTFRFWQEGPGYDRNIVAADTALMAIDYIHHNPVRRGLVETAVEWKWSSARYYLSGPPRQYDDLPTVHPLPAERLHEPR